MRYAQARKMDITNGEGLGVSLFVQGCRTGCYNCFNPETWDFGGGKEWTDEKQKNFIELVEKPYINRVSILGGEPLDRENVDGVLSLLREIKTIPQKKKIWLYTGYYWNELFEVMSYRSDDRGNVYTEFAVDYPGYDVKRDVVHLCDVVIDGRYIDELKDIKLKWRGSSNQTVIDAQKSLNTGVIVKWKNS